ncbi:hypothetical protein Val02_62490 [Virgisporangium aliadipatigenens]|uniref:SAF domain-containing protein n=1 Tax=Virgisporangium aliadipatigenens TaxID=741659 RepID=A0A8J4DTT7_9ACTN|nr:hypothetical protein Val02_62490 [Virgisporangium aliadipatigenens]
MVATVAAFWQIDLRRHAEEAYVATTRAVPAGQVVTDADLTTVQVASASGLALLPASRRSDFVGRTAAVPLAANSLLVEGQLGPAAWPPAGQAVIAVLVKAGKAPATLAAGTNVVVLVAPAAGQPATAASSPADAAVQVRRATAMVVSAVPGEQEPGSQVVTLLLGAAAAETVAGAAGDVSLVQSGAKE